MSQSTPYTSLTFVPGRKAGQENPVLNGYRFTKDKSRGEKTYYKCTLFKTGCRARITIENRELVSPLPEHQYHDTQHCETAVHIAKQGLKQQAASTDLPTRLLVANSLSNLHSGEVAKLNCELKSLSKMSRDARRGANRQPSSPPSLEDLEFPIDYITSHRKEYMLLWDSEYTPELRRSFLFGTSTNMETLAKADHLIIDFTFKSSPNLTKQMGAIHALFNDGWHIPLAFGVLPGKTQTLYTNLFREVADWADIDPQTILCDFEQGLQNAVKTIWPQATIRGCYFHFTQALWRNLQTHHLATEYNVPGSQVHKYFKIMQSFPFLPLIDIDEAWRIVKALLPADMASFADYFERTWIGTSTTAATFDRFMWNHHDSVLAGIPRSSNQAEGWHNGFHTMLQCNNPTMWKFLDCLKAEQVLVDTKKDLQQQRHPPPKRDAHWVKYDKALERIIDAYDTYDSILEFLQTIAEKV